MVSQAWNLVKNSYELADQAQLGLGLQVFQHLGMLPEVICDLVRQWEREFNSSLTTAVDVDALTKRIRSRQSNGSPGGPGAASLPISGGQAAAFYVAMWTSLDGLMDKLERFLSHCRLLGLTLLKKRETSSGLAHTTSKDRLLGAATPSLPSLAELVVGELLANWHDPADSARRNLITLVFGTTQLNLPESSSGFDSTEEEKMTEPFPTFLHNGEDEDFSEFCSQLSKSDGFLGWASGRLATELLKATEQSSQIKEALEGEYPKLLKLVLDLARRIRGKQTSGSFEGLKGASLTSAIDTPQCLTEAFAPFETAYLSRSLSRLFDRVAMSFSTSGGNVVPSTIELDGIIQSAANELAYASVNYNFLKKVARNVSKTVAMFATKIENLVAVGAAASQVTDSPTTGQQNNIRLVNTLCTFGTQLKLTCSRRLRNLPVLQSTDGQQLSSPFTVIYESLESKLNTLCTNILEPLLQSIGDTVEEHIGAIHSENFNLPDSVGGANGESLESSYIAALQELLGRIRNEYLSGLSQPLVSGPPNVYTLTSSQPSKSCSPVSDSRMGVSGCFTCGEIAFQNTLRPYLTRWIDVFVQHVSLVRPLSEHGRLRLATECKEFELSLVPLTAPDIGYSLSALVPEAYSTLRVVRSILLAETEQIVQAYIGVAQAPSGQQPLDTSLPASLVCQHLFSRAPSEIRSPYEAAGWSARRYVSWVLDRETEEERIAFLCNGLTVYAREVEMRQQKEYPPIFVLLRSFLQHFNEPSSQPKEKTNPSESALAEVMA
ncbi:unnamed protein product [Calicophoron daubneyi]